MADRRRRPAQRHAAPKSRKAKTKAKPRKAGAKKAIRRADVQREISAALSRYVYGSGGYDGAKNSRRSMRGWNPPAQSADRDTVPDLEDLRARSRDLERNAPLAAGAIHTVTSSVIGPGLHFQAQINREFLGMTKEAARAWERRTELLFEMWCRQCDMTRELDHAGMQELVLRSMLSSGDVFVVRRFIERPGELFGTRMQLIEADRICTPDDMTSNPLVFDGVETDASGAPIRYHIRNRHPHDYGGIGLGLGYTEPEWTSAPAFGLTGDRQTLHLWRKTRPGLHRGVPYLAPVIETLKQLDRYTDAELMAAVVSGMYTIVTKTLQGEGLANQEEDLEVGIQNPTLGKQEIALDYGAVLNLNPGEDAVGFNPGRPNTAFDGFVQAVLRQVGVALEMPFEVLIKHFTASYSAARAALLEAWRAFMMRRTWTAKGFCQPSYEWFLVEAVARGMIDAPGFFEDPIARMAWCGSRWTGRPQGSIDPLKEAKAAQVMLGENIATHARMTSEFYGEDWEQTLEQRAAEIAMQRELGIMPEKAPGAQQSDDGEDEEGGSDAE